MKTAFQKAFSNKLIGHELWGMIGHHYYQPYNAVCFMAGFSLGMPFLGLTSSLYKTI